jgi:predicted nucleotidyltransferase
MKRDEVISILQGRREELYRRYKVACVSLFGSTARDEARPDSDVDILVDVPAPPTFEQYMGLKLELEDLLDQRVDLVTRRGLRERIRPYIEKEAVRVP